MVTIARITPPTTGLVFQSENIKLKIGRKIIDNGVLYITINSLGWQPESVSGEGISINWREISVQGISTDPVKCIYFMLDHKLDCWPEVSSSEEHYTNGHNNGANEAEAMGQQERDGESTNDEGNITDDDYDDAPEITECWLLPEDLSTVELIFQAMNQCQALHPDSADSISDKSDVINTSEEEYDDTEFDPYGPMRNLNIN